MQHGSCYINTCYEILLIERTFKNSSSNKISSLRTIDYYFVCRFANMESLNQIVIFAFFLQKYLYLFLVAMTCH